mgnify:CR=1 FL=1
MTLPRILIVGTVDTKSDEIGFMREQVQVAGGAPLVMDVGVLAKGRMVPDITNAEVAQAAGVTLQQVMDSGDENSAMALMAKGASALAVHLYLDKRIDGLLVRDVNRDGTINNGGELFGSGTVLADGKKAADVVGHVDAFGRLHHGAEDAAGPHAGGDGHRMRRPPLAPRSGCLL